MYEPPPGFKDIDGDAEDAPNDGPLRTLTVTGVGDVIARRPRPRAISALAGAANHKLGQAEQTERLNQFIVENTGEGEFDRILLAMMNGEICDGSIIDVAYAIATWGTARPYRAVVTLAVLTAHHWRTMRGKMLAAGISDPMRLPSMHAVLDFTEQVVLESMNGNGNAKKAEGERTQFWDKLYVPDVPRKTAAADTGHRPVPSGFDPDEVEAAFDTFAKIAR